ncbi:MAG: hypothetical protein PHP31_05145 [Lentimicrobiaceae bacterium]|nr:hypothetical protein [Lentimicrobiaceae bacterium]
MMKKINIVIIMCAALVLSGCGNNSKKASSTVKSEKELLSASNESLAKMIVTIYDEAMTEMVEILEKYPQANNEMKVEFENLYESTIQKLLPIGKVIDQKDDATKDEIGSLAFVEVVRLEMPQKAIDLYNPRMSEIREFDSELNSKMVAMNIITQYAFFDLLKKQNPEEAERLGIE